MYQFDVVYPLNVDPKLQQIQTTILQNFPNCNEVAENIRLVNGGTYHNTICSTNDPSQIARVASAFRKSDSRIVIATINKNGNAIYYHPVELQELDPYSKKRYHSVMSSLPQSERIIHDYLVNLYQDVPTTVFRI